MRVIGDILNKNISFLSLYLFFLTMKHYLVKNCLGEFEIDEKLEIKGDGIGKNNNPADDAFVKKTLVLFSDKKFFPAFYEKNMELTAESLRHGFGKDNLVIQTVAAIEEIDRNFNMLAKRLREWYSIYDPELSNSNHDNERFVDTICKEFPKGKNSIGSGLDKKDLDAVLAFAQGLQKMQKQRKELEDYLDGTMQELCPNTKAVCGSLIGAKLISQAGSLKHLSELPSSTIQVLGAEKALFRHMKTGARPPKFGILFQHHLVKGSGKNARILSDKIGIAAKVDYFKGEYIGDRLVEEINKRIK